MPGMVSSGSHTYWQTIGYLIALQIQCYDFVYSKISTFDIDRTTRTITSESLDCVPRMGEIVVTVIADRTPPYTTPGPET